MSHKYVGVLFFVYFPDITRGSCTVPIAIISKQSGVVVISLFL